MEHDLAEFITPKVLKLHNVSEVRNSGRYQVVYLSTYWHLKLVTDLRVSQYPKKYIFNQNPCKT